MHKVLVHFDRNGFAYTIDRTNGVPLVAEKYDPTVNWATAINLKTGIPERDEKFSTSRGKEKHQRYLSSVGRRQGSAARSLFAKNGLVLCANQPFVHELRTSADLLRRRTALRRRYRRDVRCKPWRPAWQVHHWEPPKAKRHGKFLNAGRCGVVLLLPAVMSFSTALWTDGQKQWTPIMARCCGRRDCHPNRRLFQRFRT